MRTLLLAATGLEPTKLPLAPGPHSPLGMGKYAQTPVFSKPRHHSEETDFHGGAHSEP